MNKYLFIGGEFNGQWREANGDKELVFAELFADYWHMVCYVRQSWVRGRYGTSLVGTQNFGEIQEIYVLDTLSDEEATQLVNGL